MKVVLRMTDRTDANVTIDGEPTIYKTYGDDNFTLTASAQAQGENGALTWTSSNEYAATVDSNGTVTVNNRGETTLTASYLSDTTMGQASVTLTVQPKSLSGATVNVSGKYPYTGFAWRPFDSDVTVTLDGEELEGGKDYGFQGTEGKDAGTYTLTVYGSGNYSGRVEGNYTIAPAPLTITTGSDSKAYDGTALTNAEASVSGLAHGESITVTATGSQTEVGNGENTCTIDWGGTNKDNYEKTETLGTLRKTVSGRSTTIKKLKKGTAYKAFVRAWRTENGAKAYIGQPSPDVHAIAGGTTRKYTNPKKITVKKKKLTLTVGGGKKIKARIKKLSGGRKLMGHTKKIRYYSSNRTVATVDANGRVTGVGTGVCTVYALAENGLRVGVKITVK